MRERVMKCTKLVTAAVIAGLVALAPAKGQTQTARQEIDTLIQEYLTAHPDEVGQIAKDYLVRHPEVIGEILAAVLKHQPAKAGATNGNAPVAKAAPDRSAEIASNAAALFSSPHQVTLGNPDGDVTLVEFFDYSCGFCKRALSDLVTLIKDDSKLKIVLKELPILGPGSADAARVAVAVRMQDPDGQKYLAFHQELLGSAGPANKERALAAAKNQGLDMSRLEQDMTSDEVNATLSEGTKLAAAMSINGTPSYVVGTSIIPGAIGLAGLKGQIEAARNNHRVK